MSTYQGIQVSDPALAESFTQGELRTYKIQFEAVLPGPSSSLASSQIPGCSHGLGFKEPLSHAHADKLLLEFDLEKGGNLGFEAYLRLQLELDNPSSHWAALAAPRVTAGGRAFLRSPVSSTRHTVHHAEKEAYVRHINMVLANDAYFTSKLPMDAEGEEVFEEVNKGVLLCKLINLAAPGTIDERAVNLKDKLNPWERSENHTLALNSARAIGCSVVNIGTDDLNAAKPHLVLGLLGQIIKAQLLATLNVKATPAVVQLAGEGEGVEEVAALSSEALLLRWVNYHVKAAGYAHKITNFSSDIKDGEVYSLLLRQIAPEVCDQTPLESHGLSRASRIKEQAAKIGCDCYVTAGDIVGGAPNLNLAFVANLFRKRHGLVVDPQHAPLLHLATGVGVGEENSEESAFRQWMVSLGAPLHGSSLIQALRDGSVLLLVLSKMDSSNAPPPPRSLPTSSSSSSSSPSFSSKFVALEQCSRVVAQAREMKMRLVGIAGEDIAAGNRTLVLGLLWQLMHHHMMQMLASLRTHHDDVSDDVILQWANARVPPPAAAPSFKDKSLSSGLFFLHLLASLEERVVTWHLVTKGETEAEKEENAKYVVSLARKLGAFIFLQPRDIVEAHPKMMMMLAASLMHRHLSKKSEGGGRGADAGMRGSPVPPYVPIGAKKAPMATHLPTGTMVAGSASPSLQAQGTVETVANESGGGGVLAKERSYREDDRMKSWIGRRGGAAKEEEEEEVGVRTSVGGVVVSRIRGFGGNGGKGGEGEGAVSEEGGGGKSVFVRGAGFVTPTKGLPNFGVKLRSTKT